MSKKLYVGNLPFSMTEDQLHALFSGYGKVLSTHLVTDRFSGQSRGFGFVEMENEQEAAEAMDKVKQTPFEGRNLVVNEARPMKERRPGGGGGGGGGRFGGRKKRRW